VIDYVPMTYIKRFLGSSLVSKGRVSRCLESFVSPVWVGAVESSNVDEFVSRL
jgi:hypothetical protein